jgi:hypothetical protein
VGLAYLVRDFQGATSLKMPLNITDKDSYILVEPSKGMDYWEIMEGISKLFSMPEFKDKNDVWVFKDGPLKMYFNDLYSIIDSVAKLYPEGSKAKKTAIITETGVQHSLATLYSDIGKDLPRKIRVFSDLKSAIDWIEQ